MPRIQGAGNEPKKTGNTPGQPPNGKTPEKSAPGAMAAGVEVAVEKPKAGSSSGTSLQDWLIGKRFDITLDDGKKHRIRIKDKVGKGGMGLVLLGENEAGKKYAIKILKDNIVEASIKRNDSSGPLQRFKREIDTMMSLDHPNIIKVRGSNEFPKDGYIYPFYVMDYLENAFPLDDAQIEQVEMKTFLSGMLDIAKALVYSHQRGIYHRDIKPSNILLDRNGMAHLTDFGIAKNEDMGGTTFTETGTALGTIEFMSPEQAIGDKNATPDLLDIYSFGATLYKVIVGRSPLNAQGKTPIAMLAIAQRLDEKPIAPNEALKIKGKQITPRLAKLLYNMIEKYTLLRTGHFTNGMVDVVEKLEVILGSESEMDYLEKHYGKYVIAPGSTEGNTQSLVSTPSASFDGTVPAPKAPPRRKGDLPAKGIGWRRLFVRSPRTDKGLPAPLKEISYERNGHSLVPKSLGHDLHSDELITLYNEGRPEFLDYIPRDLSTFTGGKDGNIPSVKGHPLVLYSAPIEINGKKVWCTIHEGEPTFLKEIGEQESS